MMIGHTLVLRHPCRSRVAGDGVAPTVFVFLVLLVMAGCGEPTDESPDTSDTGTDSSDSGRIAVARGESPESAEPLELENDETVKAETEDRRALLAIFKGIYRDRPTKKYAAELVESVDADLYRDVDTNTNGPKQWITRARVVDAGGQTLWRDRVNSFFQLLEYLKLVLDQTSSANFTVRQVYGFAESEYPELLEFPVQIPLGLEGAHEYVLEVPDADGNYYEVARVAIDKLVEQAEEPSVEAEVSTLSQAGPPQDRIDVAILGDGYTADQKSEFIGDAEAVVDRFESTKPFDQHADLLNFHAVWTPSEESGAGYDCIEKKREACNRFRDTFYRYVFVVSALSDQFALDLPAAASRVAMPLEVGKMYEAAARASYDEVLMLSNTDRRSGFAGMYAGVLTAFDERDTFPDVAIHEFGHSFGVLGDEYFIQSDPCLENTPRVPLPANITAAPEPEQLKWSHWVRDETPLPTPNGKGYRIGAYPKAYNCEDLYRPAYRGKMRRSSKPFCAVCNEQLVRRLYNDVDLLRPGYPRVTLTSGGGLRLEAGVRAEGDRSIVRWRLDGERIDDATSLTLQPSAVGHEWQKLELEVQEYSTLVRKEDPRLTVSESWWVRR